MIIIAVGLMGFAAMMVNSMKNNRTAMQRSLATFYAYDIIDCMRVNRQAAIAGNYNRSFSASVPSASGTLAQRDINLWLTDLSQALPAGQAQINVVTGPTGSTATVDIQWEENINATDSGTSHQWQTVSTL